MPNYLSPGVYVEEVEAGSRPIEGVGTAVAAFVGLAAQGPFNTPTLVTNWTQFTSTFGDFVDGSYLAHSVYGYFSTAAELATSSGSARTARLPPPVPSSPAPRTRRWRRTASTPSRPARPATTSRSRSRTSATATTTRSRSRSAATATEEKYEKVTTKKGKQNVVTLVNEQSKLIQLEEIGKAGALERKPAAGKMSLSGGEAAAVTSLNPDDYIGNSADRTGIGGLEAIDPVTMLCVPDLMSAYQKGLLDFEGVKAVQLAMLTHCELMGDRVAILDPPPGLNAQQIREWRVEKAGYDSKYATLYWPWIKVFDPATGKNEFVPPSGAMAGIWGRNDDTRGVHKAPANEVVRGALGLENNITKGEQDLLNPQGHQLHPLVPGPRHPRLGRPHALERPVVALPQRPPALQLHRGVDPRGHPVGRVRAERPRPLAAHQAHDQRVPAAVSGATARCSARRRSRPSTSSATRRPTRPRSSTRPGRRRDRHRAGQAGGVRRLPYRPVLGRRGRQRVTRREEHGAT